MQKYTAEAIGTFAVVFCGCGAAAVGGTQLGALGIGLAFSVAFGAMALALAPISGAHFNPAVTLAMAAAKKLPARDVVPYVAAQLSGGVLGSWLAVALAEGRPGASPLA